MVIVIPVFLQLRLLFFIVLVVFSGAIWCRSVSGQELDSCVDV